MQQISWFLGEDPLKANAPYLSNEANLVLIEIPTVLPVAGAAAMVTRHTAYQALGLQRATGLKRTCVFIDDRNALDLAAAAAVGFVIGAMGKGHPKSTDGKKLISEPDRVKSIQTRAA